LPLRLFAVYRKKPIKRRFDRDDDISTAKSSSRAEGFCVLDEF
jgi:hypothetical protein